MIELTLVYYVNALSMSSFAPSPIRVAKSYRVSSIDFCKGMWGAILQMKCNFKDILFGIQKRAFGLR